MKGLKNEPYTIFYYKERGSPRQHLNKSGGLQNSPVYCHNSLNQIILLINTFFQIELIDKHYDPCYIETNFKNAWVFQNVKSHSSSIKN
jgi:hypothetical protein